MTLSIVVAWVLSTACSNWEPRRLCCRYVDVSVARWDRRDVTLEVTTLLVYRLQLRVQSRTFVALVQCQKCLIATGTFTYYLVVVLVAQRFGRRTFDQAIVVSIPGRGVIKAPRSTQPSVPPGQVNQVPVLLAGGELVSEQRGVCSLMSGCE